MRKITKLENTQLIPVKRKRVAAYARVSSSKDAMHHSLSAQISYYNNLIGSRGDWQLVRIYADEAITGTKDDRPEFQRLLADCRAGKIDMVIAKSVTRLARNTLTLLETVRELKALGIDVYFEKENIHTLSTDGELMLTFLASYAQEESRSASENVKWRIRKNFEKGIPNNGYLLGYRLRNGVFQVVPEEAKVVKLIFTDFLSGMGMNTIAKKLTRMGIPTRYGNAWYPNTIRQILRQDKYTGDLLLQKTYRLDHISKKKMVNHGELPMYEVKNSHEAIIDKETFAMAQKELRRRAIIFRHMKQPTEPYLFTGLLCCGLCGKHFHRRIASCGKQYPKKIVWTCSTFLLRGKDACPAKRIPESILIEKTSSVLGTEEWDWETLMGRFQEIQVPEYGRLVYIFRDGYKQEVNWQNPSRRESWTPQMKQKARARQLALLEERRKANECTE